jgi:glycosyltransferase involved in cell wall biosynthesis
VRILSIITSFTTGGAEMLVSNLSREFIAQGHEACVLALSDAVQIGNSENAEQLMRGELDAAGVKTASLSLANRRNPIAGVRALRRALADINPDVIHVHTAQAALFLAFLRPGVPLVMTHHNSRLSFPARLFFFFDTVVNHYVAISDRCAGLAKRFSRRPITKVINAASQSFRAGEARSQIADTPVILSVGALSAQKNYELLIRAAERLRDLSPDTATDLKIRIVGNGTSMPALQALVRELRLDGLVELLGQRNDVAELMQGADLYVNSSHYEGMPVAVIEALMSGLPIVATDVEGNREIVTTGENGLLVAPDDAEALAEAMIKILADPVLHAQFSRGALRSSAVFSIEATAGSHLDIYRQLVEPRELGGASPLMA